MLNRERKLADEAEENAIKAQERADKIAAEVRERLLKIDEQRAKELRVAVVASQEERRLMAQERLQALEERRQIAINDRAIMNSLAEISALLAQVVRHQQNGHQNNGDD